MRHDNFSSLTLGQCYGHTPGVVFGSLNIFTDSVSGQRFTISPMSAGRNASLERFLQAVWVRERRAAHRTASNDGWTRTSPSSSTWKLFEGNDLNQHYNEEVHSTQVMATCVHCYVTMGGKPRSPARYGNLSFVL
jgi:hypothetical protein